MRSAQPCAAINKTCRRAQSCMPSPGTFLHPALALPQSSLTISRCLYVEVFAEEGAPQLAAACCCSQDRVWLEAAQYRGVQAGRTAAISAGDPHCCYVVRRQPRAGATAR